MKEGWSYSVLESGWKSLSCTVVKLVFGQTFFTTEYNEHTISSPSLKGTIYFWQMYIPMGKNHCNQDNVHIHHPWTFPFAPFNLFLHPF